jgi:hypothetical protein
MATAGVPSGTILAVHLQKCLHLSNEIRVMQKKESFSIIKPLARGKTTQALQHQHFCC